MTNWDDLWEDNVAVHWMRRTSWTTTQDWMNRVKAEGDRLQDENENNLQRIKELEEEVKTAKNTIVGNITVEFPMGKIKDYLGALRDKVDEFEGDYEGCKEKLKALQKWADDIHYDEGYDYWLPITKFLEFHKILGEIED